MLRNRDNIRTNRANRAIQACLLGNIANDSISRITLSSDEDSNENNVELLKLVKESSDRMIDSFCSSQTSINRTTCYRYAKEQHNLIRKAFKFNENISDIASISPHVVNDDLIKMYQTLNSMDESFGKY